VGGIGGGASTGQEEIIKAVNYRKMRKRFCEKVIFFLIRSGFRAHMRKKLLRK